MGSVGGLVSIPSCEATSDPVGVLDRVAPEELIDK
jgi:hypothetical protein